MKKMFSLVILSVALMSYAISYADQKTVEIVPQKPIITESLKPAIQKYKDENYVGAMLELEEIVKNEIDNIYAKYYLALTYTQIGYKEKAIDVYQQVVDLDDNEILTYYSQKAILCLDNPTDPTCSAIGIEVVSEPVVEEKEEPTTEMGRFIESGQKIHPAAMDKITRERMDRKLQQEENIKKQLEAEQQETQKIQKRTPRAIKDNKQSQIPTNEEIAQALNILARVGVNVFSQNPMTSYAQFNPMSAFNSFNQNQNNFDMSQMYLNQLLSQQNFMNYGI